MMGSPHSPDRAARCEPPRDSLWPSWTTLRPSRPSRPLTDTSHMQYMSDNCREPPPFFGSTGFASWPRNTATIPQTRIGLCHPFAQWRAGALRSSRRKPQFHCLKSQAKAVLPPPSLTLRTRIAPLCRVRWITHRSKWPSGSRLDKPAAGPTATGTWTYGCNC